MDLDTFNTSAMVGSLQPAVDYKDAFFQDVREHIEPLVRNSLFQLLAYQYKGEEAEAYKEDPKANVPMLGREAELRGITIPDMVAMVERNGTALKSTIKELELVRIEYNLRYAKVKEELDRLQLRDEFIARVKAITEALG
jgi:hypothetical protein